MSEARQLPAWAEDLRRRYLRGEASMFVLHGNVFDTVVHAQQMIGLTDFLAGTLLKDAVSKFADPFDKLMGSIEKKRQQLQGGLAPQSFNVGQYADDVKKGLEDWRTGGKVRQLWARDAA